MNSPLYRWEALRFRESKAQNQGHTEGTEVQGKYVWLQTSVCCKTAAWWQQGQLDRGFVQFSRPCNHFASLAGAAETLTWFKIRKNWARWCCDRVSEPLLKVKSRIGKRDAAWPRGLGLALSKGHWEAKEDSKSVVLKFSEVFIARALLWDRPT